MATIILKSKDQRARSNHETSLIIAMWSTLLSLIVIISVANAKVIQVQILARHGLRSEFAPNELQPWDDGGALSGHGLRKMSQLGELLRNRYTNSSTPDFVESDWNVTTLPLSVLARSTDTLTTMLSAVGFMTGLFPDGAGPVDELDGANALPHGATPIGLHTVPIPLDIPLRAYDKCPNLGKEVIDVLSNAETSAMMQSHQAACQQLGQHVGMNVTAGNFLDIFEVAVVERAFGINTTNGTGLAPEIYDECSSIADQIAAKTFTSPTEAKMIGGRVVASFINQIMGAVDTNQMTIPLAFLSGHYPTYMAAAKTLGIYNQGGIPSELPSPGAMIIVELHQQTESTFEVRLLVHDPNRGHNMVEIRQSDCQDRVFCPVNQFLSSVQPNALETPQDWCQLCNNTITPPCSEGGNAPAPPQPCQETANTDGSEATNDFNKKRLSTGTLLILGALMGMVLTVLLVGMARCLSRKMSPARLLAPLESAWNRRGTSLPAHVEMQSA